MEFVFHKKPKAALEAIAALVSKCRSYGSDIEFVAVDATRAEAEFLREAIKCAIESGATRVCVCDSAAALLPEDFASFVSALRADVSGLSEIPLGVQASGELGMAESSCVAAFRAGADYVRASVTDKKEPSVEVLSHIIGQKGDEIGVSSNLNTPELTRLAKQIRRIAGGADIIILPEIPFDMEAVVNAVARRAKNGKLFPLWPSRKELWIPKRPS